MANIIKISAAGSGKTYDICHDALDVVADSDRRVLIVTYTNRGEKAVETEIRKQNKGVLHPRITVKTWFHFLLSDAIKPYQRYIVGDGSFNVLKGIDFSQTYGIKNFHKIGTKARYLTKARNVLSNYVSELACFLNKKNNGKSVGRLAEIYSNIYFDEVQDLAGDDINFLKLLLDSDISITCCGDNKQATYSTHNAKKNKRQTGKNIWQFFNNLTNVNIEKNLVSRRFNQDICSFANMLFPVGDTITTIMNEKTEHDGVFLIDVTDVETYYKLFHPQILRYDAKTKVERFCAVNFGACKGETFDRILIYPNGPLTNFVVNGSSLNAPEKYYVAVTRPRFSIAIALETLPARLCGFEEEFLNCEDSQIRCLKYIVNG